MDDEKKLDEISERLYKIKEEIIIEYFDMTQADNDLKVEYYSLNDELMKLEQKREEK